MKRNTIAKTFTIAAVTALVLGIAPTAKADNKGCSNASLKGTFAHRGTGAFTAPPAMAGPVAGLTTQTFDGNGGMTSAGFVSANGNVIPITETGTYTVNPDCTGTYTVKISPLGVTAHGFFVILDSFNEYQDISTDAGTVFSGVGRRQFPIGDWRQ